MPRTDATRRRFLGATAAIAAGFAGCAGGANSGSDTDSASGSSDGGSPPSFDGYLAETSNYDGVADRAGASETTVEVGVEANGAYYGYGPAAIRVSTGTTVVWEWTGQGSLHNVVAEDGAFSSEQVREAGHTYSRTFEEPGTVKYYCTPHETLGMKGVVIVEE